MRLRSRPLLLTVPVFLWACGTGQTPDTGITAALPDQLPQAQLERTGDVRVFAGDSLWEYINGGAELYHEYRFVEVATAQYSDGTEEYVADVYSFETPLYAYGMYTALRPEGVRELGLGVAGFGSESTVDVVIGEHLVRVVAFGTEATGRIQTAAAEVSSGLPGSALRPTAFGLFPAEHQKISADRFIATSFLGQAFLTEVYSQGYARDEHEFTLFLCESDPDTKLVLWLAESPPSGDDGPDLRDMEAGSQLWIPDSYDGAIVAGKVGRYLAGVVGYDESLDELLSNWFEKLRARDLPVSDI